MRTDQYAPDSAAAMNAAAERLLARVGHWTAVRWATPARESAAPAGHDAPRGPGAPRSRADVVGALVQRLADLGAAAEGRLPRPVPRLDNELALPDQVRVMVRDLVAAGSGETFSTATRAIENVLREL
jgi:hypothetical protein